MALTYIGRFALALLVSLLGVFVVGNGKGLASGGLSLAGSQEPPSNAVAVVNYPSHSEAISLRSFHLALAQEAAFSHLKHPPVVGHHGYGRLKIAALKRLLDESWISGQAAEMKIVVTHKEIASHLRRIKRHNFQTPAEYRRYLRTFHLTQADVNDSIKLQLLSTAIRAQVLKGVKGNQARHKAFENFVEEYFERWKSRTVCAPGYVFGRCSNSGRKSEIGKPGAG